MKPNLALFDFDGTLTRMDSLFEFISFVHGRTAFYSMMASTSPWLFLMKLNLLSAQTTKERLLRKAIGGITTERFKQLCKEFCVIRLPGILRKAAIEKLEAHRKQGDKIFIVSASPEDWIIPWANAKMIEVISTKLKTENGLITGDIDGLNCNGIEKVNRIKKHLRLEDFDKIYAYGDSSGDRELLRLADFPFYKKFN